jgi:uncharacterized protein YkwD
MKSAALDKYQKAAMGLMGLMVLLTFALTNLQAVLWQASDTLVSAVLPSVVVDLTNDERDDVAAAPLIRNEALDAAAQLKAEHMAQNQYFAHYAPDGTTPWYWFDQAGYVYAHAGENLAIHFTDSAEVVEAWMDSPTHRANIVDQKFTEIGVGTARGRFDGHRTVYVVQLFGAPGVSAPVAPTPAPTPQPVELALVEDAETIDVPTAPEAVAAAEIDLESTVPDERPVETSVPATARPVDVALNPEPVPISEAERNQEPSSALALEAVSLPDASTVLNALSLRQSMIATSSGLAVANVATDSFNQPLSFLALATQPNTVMQVVYALIALMVFVLLIVSFVNELRHAHPLQVGYSVAMLLLMTGLYWLHTNLTDGAIIV